MQFCESSLSGLTFGFLVSGVSVGRTVSLNYRRHFCVVAAQWRLCLGGRTWGVGAACRERWSRDCSGLRKSSGGRRPSCGRGEGGEEGEGDVLPWLSSACVGAAACQ